MINVVLSFIFKYFINIESFDVSHYSYKNLAATNNGANNTTVTQHVYEALREEIVTGILSPGVRLVRRTVGKRFGVSHNPVTEALLKLELDGLVENEPLYGSRVRSLSLDDMVNDQLYREAIECQAARLCAENASDADLSTMASKAKVIDRMLTQADPSSKVGNTLHMDLHLTIANCAKHCPSLALELQRVWFRWLMRLSWIKGTVFGDQPDDWHLSLIEAIASGNPDKAEEAMREHVRKNQEYDRETLTYFLENNK